AVDAQSATNAKGSSERLVRSSRASVRARRRRDRTRRTERSLTLIRARRRCRRALREAEPSTGESAQHFHPCRAPARYTCGPSNGVAGVMSNGRYLVPPGGTRYLRSSTPLRFRALSSLLR